MIWLRGEYPREYSFFGEKVWMLVRGCERVYGVSELGCVYVEKCVSVDVMGSFVCVESVIVVSSVCIFNGEYWRV